MPISEDQNRPGEFEFGDIFDAAEADRHAKMLDEIYIDADLLDPLACPPDRRFYLGDKEAWVYEHGNICELVYVRREAE